jgi:ArsR family transcriptional regulator
MMLSTHQLQQSKGKEEPQQGYCGAIASPTLSDEQAQQYAEWFKVLADSTRLRILNLLAQNTEPLCVCDIVDCFNLGQPTISHHLKILRDSCFVKTERHANFIYYSINHECVPALPDAARLIMGL